MYKQFLSQYDSRVVIYERKLFIRLATVDPKVKQISNVATNVLHNFYGFVINTKAYTLGLIQPPSPSTKELHDPVNAWDRFLHRQRDLLGRC